ERGAFSLPGAAGSVRACLSYYLSGEESITGSGLCFHTFVLDSLADQGMTPLREKLALNVVPPTMSAPIRSQSGSRFALRIQLCRSGINGVPGNTMGLGAESQRKLRA